MDPKRLRQLRRKQGLTQKQLAYHLGVTLNTVSRWELGQVSISRPMVRLLRLILVNKAGKR